MRFRFIGTIALLAGVVICAASAAATTPRTGGKIYIHASGNDNGPAGTIVIVGAVGDHGKTLQMDRNGKVDSNGNFVRITLRKGTFMIDSTALDKIASKQHPAIQNFGTCSFLETATGPVKLFDGTGAYDGISGTATVTITFGGVSPFYTSGQHKGHCNTNVAPIADFGSVTGPGTVSFS